MIPRIFIHGSIDSHAHLIDERLWISGKTFLMDEYDLEKETISNVGILERDGSLICCLLQQVNDGCILKYYWADQSSRSNVCWFDGNCYIYDSYNGGKYGVGLKGSLAEYL